MLMCERKFVSIFVIGELTRGKVVQDPESELLSEKVSMWRRKFDVVFAQVLNSRNLEFKGPQWDRRFNVLLE